MIARAENPSSSPSSAGRDDGRRGEARRRSRIVSPSPSSSASRATCACRPTTRCISAMNPDAVLANPIWSSCSNATCRGSPARNRRRATPRSSTSASIRCSRPIRCAASRATSASPACSARTLPALTEALKLSRQGRSARPHRGAAQASCGKRAAQRERWAATFSVRRKDATPMHPAWITHCVNEVKGRGHDHRQGIAAHLGTSRASASPAHSSQHRRGGRAGLGARHLARHADRRARRKLVICTCRRRRLHVRQSGAGALRLGGGEAADPHRRLQQPDVGRGEAQHARGLSGRLCRAKATASR